MSELTIIKKWEYQEPDFDPVAVVYVDCSDGLQQNLVFNGFEPDPQTVHTEDDFASCILVEEVFDSRAENGGSCAGLVVLDPGTPTYCTFTSAVFHAVGVPTMGVAGVGILVALVLAVGIKQLRW